MIMPAPRASSHTDRARTARSGREATIGRDDEARVLVLLLALAAALYLVVWLIERPEGDGRLPEPVTAEEAAPGPS
jgi:hypothetical protein